MRRYSHKIFAALILVIVLAFSASAKGKEIKRETYPLERNGIKLHLESFSSGERGEPLLLVHGLTYSSHEFDVNYSS